MKDEFNQDYYFNRYGNGGFIFVNTSDKPITIDLNSLLDDIPSEIDAELSLLDLMMSEEKRKKLILIL